MAMGLPPKKMETLFRVKNSHASFSFCTAKDLSVYIKTIGIIPNFDRHKNGILASDYYNNFDWI